MKGAEREFVAMIGLDGWPEHFAQQDGSDPLDLYCLYYVGVTRAQPGLCDAAWRTAAAAGAAEDEARARGSDAAGARPL